MEFNNYVAPPIKNWRTTLERLEKFISRDFYTQYNLTSKLYEDLFRFKSALHLKVEDNRPLFNDVITKQFSEKCDLTKSFGPTWSTHWFKFDFSTDLSTAVKEKVSKLTKCDKNTTIGFVWNCDCEALIYSCEGVPLQAFSGERTFFRLPENFLCENTENQFYVELACNGMFGAGEHCIQPPKLDRSYSVKDVKIVARNDLAFEVYVLLEMVHDLAKELTDKSVSGSRALFTANHVVNQLCINGMDNIQLEKALNTLKTLFPSDPTKINANEEHLTIDAFGHCHIDTAWLWPYDETKRKCARSWCNQIALMSRNSNFKFVCSQTQQFQWVERNYPALFQQIVEYTQKGQFIPVGGTWIEMDGNVPSCESFCRQFLYGQMYFKEKFGNFTDIFWLPDTFGYSTSLPQIANLSGIQYFLTQKLSWNLVNTFPHNSLIWEGIDGSQLLTHFPPNDNYCARLNPNELIFAEKNFKDKGRSSEAIMLFGYGDGGGGPTEEMVMRLDTLSSGHQLAMPKCKTTTPSQFFQRLESRKANLCKWVGELYLELHQGTFTTQSEIKRRNSQMEVLLRAAEFYLAICDLLPIEQDVNNLRSNVKEAWELVLCNQFHDVLPGSCIEEVVQNAMTYYDKAESLIKFPSLENSQACKIDLASWSIKQTSDIQDSVKALVSKEHGDMFCLQNEFLTAKFNTKGQITSLKIPDVDKDLASASEPISIFRCYHDMPLFWDAWDIMDYFAETKVDVSATNCEVVNNTSLMFKYEVGSNSFELSVSLNSDSQYLEFSLDVNWQEAHKLLKVEFPFNVRCTKAFYGSQIGFVERTNNLNTSHDTAKHEVCGHKWAAMQQFGIGCAILAPTKYGFRALESTIALSLLRSPKSPDANADMGHHKISYALMPYKGTFQEANVPKVANEFLMAMQENRLLVSIPKTVKSSLQNLIVLSTDAVRIECFKHAEIHPKGFVLRLAEQFGSSVSCEVKISDLLPLKKYLLCDILERPLAEDGEFTDLTDCIITVRFEPFKLINLLIIQ